MLRLANDAIELIIRPDIGGSVFAFRWRGRPIFRDTPDSVQRALDASNYPLVPYSNRIAFARFGKFRTQPNLPDLEPLHLIHGTGFLAEWEVVGDRHLRHVYNGPDWPGEFTAYQQFELHDDGYSHHIGMTNDSDSDIPAGLGIHPHFPRAGAELDIELSGKWINDDDRIPYRHDALTEVPDWFTDELIDNGYTGRKGDIQIRWPRHALTIRPDDDLAHTIIFSPPDRDFFCVEPVSHMIDAANRTGSDAMRMLAPGENWTVKTRFIVTGRES